mgnify:CR=1 FL=1
MECNLVEIPGSVSTWLGNNDLIFARIQFNDQPSATANGPDSQSAEAFVTMMNRIQTRSATLKAEIKILTPFFPQRRRF